MDKYFVINLRDQYEYEYFNDSSRKHFHIKLTNSALKAVKNLKHLKSFQAKNIRFGDLDNFHETLESNKSSLEILELRDIEKYRKGQEKVQFKKLIKLSFTSSDPQILKLIDASTIKVFEISSQKEMVVDDVIKLLQRQPELEELSIKGVVGDQIFNSTEIYNLPFQLKKLMIVQTNLCFEKTKKFLSCHRNRLKSLKLQYPIDLNLYKYVMINMPNLQHLEIPAWNERQNVNEIPIIVNRQITNIKLCGCLTSKTFNVILNDCSSIVNLDVSQVTQKFQSLASFVAKNCKQLESLGIPETFFHNDFDPYPLFPRLVNLTISKISNMNMRNVEDFILNHAATLESIQIESMSDNQFSKSLIIDNIIKCKNLKYVKIACESPLAIRMFNKRVNREMFSWILEATFKGISDTDVIVKFKFPDDLAVWQERCRIYDDNMIRTIRTCNNYGTNAFVNKYK